MQVLFTNNEVVFHHNTLKEKVTVPIDKAGSGRFSDNTRVQLLRRIQDFEPIPDEVDDKFNKIVKDGYEYYYRILTPSEIR